MEILSNICFHVISIPCVTVQIRKLRIVRAYVLQGRSGFECWDWSNFVFTVQYPQHSTANRKDFLFQWDYRRQMRERKTVHLETGPEAKISGTSWIWYVSIQYSIWRKLINKLQICQSSVQEISIVTTLKNLSRLPTLKHLNIWRPHQGLKFARLILRWMWRLSECGNNEVSGSSN